MTTAQRVDTLISAANAARWAALEATDDVTRFLAARRAALAWEKVKEGAERG